METRNYLFPGKVTTTRAFHRFNVIGRLLIALVLLIVIDGLLAVGTVLLQRFWY